MYINVLVLYSPILLLVCLCICSMLCYFRFPRTTVVLFINKVTCPIYITTLIFGSRNNDKICINISTVNSCFKGTILNVNENFIKWVCNKKFIQFEYILWILLIDNVYRFVFGIFTYNYPPLSLLISNVYWLVYHIFTCIDYFG
jgi:hypothetical protein